MEPEIFDPSTETWTTEAPMQVPRLYHSTALLLPDGRVWVAGTDGETRMEVHSPDYLSRGVRPVITDAPASVTYGQGFPIHLLEGGDLSSVSFIRLSAVTHCFNMGLRFVALDFAPGDPGGFQITAPADANLAPPGYYMLFVLTARACPPSPRSSRLSRSRKG